MNIIDHSSDEIRQIVPADFSFLSDADLSITAALQAVLDRASGTANGSYIISGCQLTPDPSDPDYGRSYTLDGVLHTFSMQTHGGTAVGSYSYSLASGVILHGGRLYTLAGGSFLFNRTDTLLTLTSMHRKEGFVVFSSPVAAPSPVYGESLALDQSPHRSLSAAVAQGEIYRSLVDEAQGRPETVTVDGSPADYVPVASLLTIPKLATFPNLQ